MFVFFRWFFGFLLIFLFIFYVLIVFGNIVVIFLDLKRCYVGILGDGGLF